MACTLTCVSPEGRTLTGNGHLVSSVSTLGFLSRVVNTHAAHSGILSIDPIYFFILVPNTRNSMSITGSI